MPPRRPLHLNRESGFALLIVLWTLVLISFLVAQLSAAARTEVRISTNLAANAAAQAAADGGIYEAIFNRLDPRLDLRWPLDGTARAIVLGHNRVTLRLLNEAARINPNLASPLLVEALLRVLGCDPAQSAALALAISEWAGKTQGRRPLSEIQAEYRDAGLSYVPPGAPLESIDELSQVVGMTPELMVALRPHLTLFGPAEPDPAAADPRVAEALALATQMAPRIERSAGTADDAITVQIRSVAKGGGNALATRIAVARIGQAMPGGYALMSWSVDEE